MALLILLATVRRVFHMVEHPLASKLPYSPWIRGIQAMAFDFDKLHWQAYQVRWLLVLALQSFPIMHQYFYITILGPLVLFCRFGLSVSYKVDGLLRLLDPETELGAGQLRMASCTTTSSLESNTFTPEGLARFSLEGT